MLFKRILLLCLFIIISNSIYSKEIEKSNDKNKSIKTVESVYKRPYSLLKNDIEYNLLFGGMATMFVGSIGGAGVLYLLPESITNWKKDDISNIFKQWKENVSEGPVMDNDDLFLNWVTHPYWGAVYYMSARSAGANIFISFLYSSFLSTFFWEYGIEAFAEVPSKQDIFITPIVGSLFGEGFYLAKRYILNNDGKFLKSKFLGKFTMILMDPITEITKLFVKPDIKNIENRSFALYSGPILDRHGGFGYGVNLYLKF